MPSSPTRGAALQSPCVQVCVMDPDSGLCEGCGRTLDEIGAWAALSDEERSAIMAALPERQRTRGKDF